MQVEKIGIITVNRNRLEPAFTGKIPRDFYRPKHIGKFFAYKFFNRYNPVKFNFGDYKIPVHNEAIAQKLKSSYTPENFTELFDFAKKKGVFDYTLDAKNGFVKTSQINFSENELMSGLIWTTDTCHNIPLIKHNDPKSCTKVFNSLTDLYNNQQKNFDYVIANPQKYSENEFYPSKVGVGHAFIPKTKMDHHWFSRARLESLGMYLQTAADLISDGFKGAEYGYKSFEEIPKNVITTISNSVKYLKAINYPKARSCGAWEEHTFINSLTSDTAIINEGFRKILDLVYSDTTNPELLKFRNALKNTKYGDVFDDKDALIKLLKSGERRIEDVHYHESMTANVKVKPHEENYLGRKSDAAMAFVPQTETINNKSVIGDSIAKIGMLRQLERDLVRDNGALRYNKDEYLNLDYHTITNKYTQNKHKNEAEWFLVSEISKGYGKVVEVLIDEINKNGASSKINKLLDYALKKETEFINRSYARITPKRAVKSNRYSCPAYKIPEAYEAVTTKQGVKFVPGAHTPLTWAESSLFEASELFLKNLQKLAEKN